jgi:hypothetical protein
MFRSPQSGYGERVRWGMEQIAAVSMAALSLILTFVSEGRLNRLARHPELPGADKGPMRRRALIRFGFAREAGSESLRRDVRWAARWLRLGLLLFVGALLLWFRRTWWR